MKQGLSYKLSNMGLVCAVLVVSIHVGLDGPAGSAADWLKNLVAEGFARIAVPYFFVAAGFLLARHFGERGWWRAAVCKRVRTLIVPLVIWSVLFGLACKVLGFVSDVVAGREHSLMTEVPEVLAWMGLLPFRSPALFALWFVRTLFIFVLLSPLLGWCVRRMGMLWLSALFVAQCFVYWASPTGPVGEVLNHLLSVSGLFYFSLGIFLSIKGGVRIRLRKSVSACLVAMGIGGMAIYFEGLIRVNPLPILIPPMLLGVWLLMPERKWASYLVGMTFPIYVLHLFAMLFFAYTSRWTMWMNPVVHFVFRWAGMVVLPIVFASLLRRFMPRLSGVVFGGR